MILTTTHVDVCITMLLELFQCLLMKFETTFRLWNRGDIYHSKEISNLAINTNKFELERMKNINLFPIHSCF